MLFYNDFVTLNNIASDLEEILKIVIENILFKVNLKKKKTLLLVFYPIGFIICHLL